MDNLLDMDGRCLCGLFRQMSHMDLFKPMSLEQSLLDCKSLSILALTCFANVAFIISGRVFELAADSSARLKSSSAS